MTDGRDTSGWAAGLILLAGLMMIMVGMWQALVAIFENEFHVATRNYLFQFDATTWGWIHLLLGLLVAFAGWGLLSGRTWARVVAITLAVLSAIANFLWLPYYLFWSLLIIAVTSQRLGGRAAAGCACSRPAGRTAHRPPRRSAPRPPPLVVPQDGSSSPT